MKKLILSLSICALSGSFAFGQISFSTNNQITGNNIGINTSNPDRPLTIQAATGATELLSLKNNSGTSLWHLNLNGNGLNCAETGVADNRLFLSPGGNVGIGTGSPIGRFQVGSGITKVSMGASYGADLNYGISYLGFNAAKSGSNWYFDSDGANNGGAVMYSSVIGQLFFVAVPRTTPSATTQQILTNTQIANHTKMTINPTGKVGIGTNYLPASDALSGSASAEYLLYVDGGIKAEEVKVEVSGGTWGDFVFEENYPLLSLPEVEQQIQETGHLHNVQSAAEIEENGLELKDITVNQQIKIEELYLHLIEMDKRIKALEEENKALKAALIK